MTAPDEPDLRVRCPKCASPVNVEATNPYERTRTGRRWLCTHDDTYFGQVDTP